MQLSVTNIRMLFDKLTESLTYTAIAKECDTQALIRYFASFKHKDRLQVKFIVMDMSIQFKRIMEALFPHAHIICD